MMPVYPGANAAPEALALYAVEMDRFKAETARLHAQAQTDTAAAMAAMRPVPQSEADMKRMMLLDIVARQPHHLMMTEVSACASAKKLVDEIFKAYPLP